MAGRVNKVVVVVNGHPRSGKDTVVDKMTKQLTAIGWQASAISSIDPIREMLRGIGIPVDKKTPAERDLLAGVKACLDAYDHWATRACICDALGAMRDDARSKDIVFLHVREPAAIAFTKNNLPDGVKFLTIFVDRPDAERVTSNAADAGVELYPYDLRIRNHGSLADLDMTVIKVVDGIDQISEMESTIGKD